MTATQDEEQVLDKAPEVSRGTLWFGFLGGALAWIAHLMLTYAIAEWGCQTPLSDLHFLGVHGTAWLLILVSAGLIGVAGYAAWTGHADEQKLREAEGESGKVDESRHPGIYIGHSGLILSGLFAFIIVVESIPTFFFLQHC